jgi:putative FmdB family regulatory protein
MPFYDYRCTECAHEVEVMHGIHDKGPATCQHCGAAMRKALSPPAIHFKGSGWAKKDARKAAPAKAQPAAGASENGAATGQSGADGAKEAKSSASDTSKTGSTSDSTDSKTASSAGTSSD